MLPLRLCPMPQQIFFYYSFAIPYEKVILSNRSSQSDVVSKNSKWIKFWYVLSEFKCLWLVAGNRCLQCDGLGEVGMLNEVGGLTVEGRGGDIR